MKIGILGLGVVGTAIKHGFEKLGHTVKFYDPVYEGEFEDILDTEVCYVCVPTPSDDNGVCDITIVEESIKKLFDFSFKGLVAIKSTVLPGTTRKMSEQYPNMQICFVPEFLRERCAFSDFVDNHDVCIIGVENPHAEQNYELIKRCHGKLPKKFVKLTTVEAEISKYFNNCYNAMLIIFANSFYELCDRLDASYAAVKDACSHREHINDEYLQCNENFRGFGGVCLPKDTVAMAKLAEELNLNIDFFRTIVEENKKYKTTVFNGMRKS
jgi:UDPglucose 6-dehydrogenase